MFKFLLTSLLFVSTVAVMVQGILFYELNTAEWVSAEEGSSDSTPELKEGNDTGHEKITVPVNFYCSPAAKNEMSVALRNLTFFSKGFYEKPYNPPEAV